MCENFARCRRYCCSSPPPVRRSAAVYTWAAHHPSWLIITCSSLLNTQNSKRAVRRYASQPSVCSTKPLRLPRFPQARLNRKVESLPRLEHLKLGVFSSTNSRFLSASWQIFRIISGLRCNCPSNYYCNNSPLTSIGVSPFDQSFVPFFPAPRDIE